MTQKPQPGLPYLKTPKQKSIGLRESRTAEKIKGKRVVLRADGSLTEGTKKRSLLDGHSGKKTSGGIRGKKGVKPLQTEQLKAIFEQYKQSINHKLQNFEILDPIDEVKQEYSNNETKGNTIDRYDFFFKLFIARRDRILISLKLD